MKKNLLFPLLMILLSCQHKSKTLDAGHFTIEVPSSWKILKQKSIDSFVGKIAIDETDTISFDLGWYSSSLEEEKSYYLENDRVFLRDKEKSKSDTLFYKYYGRKDTVNLEKFLKNKVSFEIIDNKKVKIIYPKKTGHGTTGIYIDSVWVKGSEVDRFQLNGEDLKPENEKKLLYAIRTIKFKE
ncbi:hypothetical protein [Pedobacter foliorum]|uniref:hypothetical protein n=1 Tax=Pedobacter foliorum TaxID=2739058 RepID=UPI001564DBA9|nr:hypothetical protein [Pedobacter foliorum]NRF38327.1 hypothetical protein [Pedobacter foliorum]